MTNVVKLNENLPRALPAEQTTRDVSTFLDRWHRAHNEDRPRGLSHHEHLLTVIETMLPEAEALLARVEKFSAPASKTQLANHLAVLLKSFPNAGKDDAEVFGRMLCEDVGAQHPTVGGIEAACRHLRRTSRFIPTISEVLAALAEAEESQRKTIVVLSSFPTQRERLALRIQEDRARNEEWEREYERQAERRAKELQPRHQPTERQADDANAGSPF
jgi:hypothetical protein